MKKAENGIIMHIINRYWLENAIPWISWRTIDFNWTSNKAFVYFCNMAQPALANK